MWQKVLLAYNFSPESDKALHWVIDSLMRPLHVLVVTVFEISRSPVDNLAVFGGQKVHHPHRQRCVKEIPEIVRELTTAGFAARSVILEGEPSFELLGYIDAEQPDLVVCGAKESRRMVGFGTLMPRSVSHTLVTYSPKPVLVVK